MITTKQIVTIFNSQTNKQNKQIKNCKLLLFLNDILQFSAFAFASNCCDACKNACKSALKHHETLRRSSQLFDDPACLA